MAAACPKSFSTKWDEEMYFDLEYQKFCKNFKFSVSLVSSSIFQWPKICKLILYSSYFRTLSTARFATDIMQHPLGNRFVEYVTHSYFHSMNYSQS